MPSKASAGLLARYRARAEAILRDHRGLDYMQSAHEDEGAPLSGVDRYLLVSDTDGNDDAWVDYYPSLPQLAKKITDLAADEWGYRAIYDLANGRELTPRIRVTFARRGMRRS